MTGQVGWRIKVSSPYNYAPLTSPERREQPMGMEEGLRLLKWGQADSPGGVSGGVK